GARHVVPSIAGTLLAAVAAYLVCAVASGVFRTPAPDGSAILFLITVGVFTTAPLAMAAYYAFTRRYSDLFMVFAVVVAFVGVGVVMDITSPAFKFLVNHPRDDAWGVLALLAVLFLFLGPFYAAQWFIRRCSRFAATWL